MAPYGPYALSDMPMDGIYGRSIVAMPRVTSFVLGIARTLKVDHTTSWYFANVQVRRSCLVIGHGVLG